MTKQQRVVNLKLRKWEIIETSRRIAGKSAERDYSSSR